MILTGKIVYPHLFTPQAIDEKSDKKFSCSLLLPKSDPHAAEVVAKVDSLINEKLGGEPPDDRYMPVKDGDDAGNPDYAGCWELRCKSKDDQRPGVVDGALNLITDPSHIVGGDNVRISVNLYAYNKRYRGIGIQLNNVQFISKGEKVIGAGKKRPEDEFEPIPGSKPANSTASSFLNG